MKLLPVLGARPNFMKLAVGSGSHAQQTAQIMQRFEPVLLEYKSDWVLVIGDANSTLACALVASKLGIKVAHIEAVLRSFDRTMPEKINCLLTVQIADLRFTPPIDGDMNLLQEGVAREKTHLVGQDKNRVRSEVERILAGKGKKGRVPPLWNGRVGERVADIVVG